MCALQFYMLFYVLVYRNVGVVANRGVIHTLQNCFLSVGVEPWIMSSHTLLWTASQPSHLQVAATQLINMDETIECANCKAGE